MILELHVHRSHDENEFVGVVREKISEHYFWVESFRGCELKEVLEAALNLYPSAKVVYK